MAGDYTLPCGCFSKTVRTEKGSLDYIDEGRCSAHMAPIWTHYSPKGTHPMTPNDTTTNDSTTTVTMIPAAVNELIIKRGTYASDHIYVTMKGDTWTISLATTEAEVLTRVHEIAAAMEAVK